MRPGLAIVLAVFSVLAAPGGADERRVALVFGTETYLALRPLANPLNDARRVLAELRALGFEAELHPDRDLRRMRRALRDFQEDAAGADVAVVFFAGHAFEVAGRNLLLPVDADPADAASLTASALPLDEVVEAARAAARRVLVVIDACRDDPFGLALADEGDRSAAPLERALPPSVAPGLRLMGRSEGVVYAFAAAPGETAADGTGPNSPFTAALGRFLATEGVDVRTALVLVQQDVYDRTRGRQLPYVESGLPAALFLNPGAAAETERERLLLAMAGLTPALRARIEAAAVAAGIPLAPLYASVLAVGDPDGVDAGRLADLAAEVARAQFRPAQTEPTDPAARALRDRAAEALDLGEFALARALIDEAIAIDRAAGDAAAGVLIARRVAEADGLRVRADIAYLAGADADEFFVPAYVAAARAYARADALARMEGRPLDRPTLLRALDAAARSAGLSAWLLTHGVPPDRALLVEGTGLVLDLLEQLLPEPDAPDHEFEVLDRALTEGVLYAIDQTRAVWDLEVVWQTDDEGKTFGEFVEADRGPFNAPEVMDIRRRALAWAEAFHLAGLGRPHPWAPGSYGRPALVAALETLADAHEELGATAEARALRERAAALAE